MYDRQVLNNLRCDGDLLLRVVQRHVALSSGGKGRCPFHQEKTPSFYVVADKSFCHCFGCGWGGDVFDFAMTLHGLDFRAAVEEVADEAGLTLTDSSEYTAQRRVKTSMLEICGIAHDYFRSQVQHSGCQNYLEKRGLLDAVDEWELGYAPDSWRGLTDYLRSKRVDLRVAQEAGLVSYKTNFYDFFRGRVIFPIRNNRGQVVGFAGRSLGKDQQPKYLNTRETPIYQKGELLFGLAKANPHIRKNKRIVLVEGYTDVIACHAAGVGEAVAACGTALTSAHVAKISRLSPSLVAAKDPDQAGMASMQKDLTPLLKAGVYVSRAHLPGLDPDEMLQARGAEALLACINRASPLLPEVLTAISREYDWGPQGRQQAALAALPVLKAMQGVGRDQAVDLAARILGVQVHGLARMVRGRRLPRSGWGTTAPPQLEPIAAQLIWALVHHYERALPLVEAGLRVEWLGQQEALILGSLMQGAPIPVAVLQLQPYAAQHLRVIGTKRAEYGAGSVRSLVRECCIRIELMTIDSRMRQASDPSALQRRRIELIEKLGSV